MMFNMLYSAQRCFLSNQLVEHKVEEAIVYIVFQSPRRKPNKVPAWWTNMRLFKLWTVCSQFIVSHGDWYFLQANGCCWYSTVHQIVLHRDMQDHAIWYFCNYSSFSPPFNSKWMIEQILSWEMLQLFSMITCIWIYLWKNVNKFKWCCNIYTFSS